MPMMEVLLLLMEGKGSEISGNQTISDKMTMTGMYIETFRRTDSQKMKMMTVKPWLMLKKRLPNWILILILCSINKVRVVKDHHVTKITK